MRDNIYKQMHKTFIPSKRNDYQPIILRPKNLFVLAVILLVVKLLIFSWFFYFPKTSDLAIVTSTRLIELAEQERLSNNLPELKINAKLTLAAQEKAQDMLKNNYFAHTSPSGVTPWYWFNKAGYNYVAAGENLAKDFTDSEFLHKAWMNSPSHRANILNGKYNEIGIAVLEGEMNGKKTIVAVQLFGKAATTKKPVAQPAATSVNTTNVGLGTTVAPNNETEPEPEQTTIAGQEPIKGTETEKITIEEIPAMEETINLNSQNNIIDVINEKSEPIMQKIYFIIAALVSLVLLLTVFINIRVQYPRVILGSIIFILLIAGIACFNVHSFLNKNIDTLDGAFVDNIIIP